MPNTTPIYELIAGRKEVMICKRAEQRASLLPKLYPRPGNDQRGDLVWSSLW